MLVVRSGDADWCGGTQIKRAWSFSEAAAATCTVGNRREGAMGDIQIITPETVETLGELLTILPVGETVYITANDFKRLTGDNLADFTAEGRLMIGNLSARTNCTVATSNDRVIFTKNPSRNIHPTISTTAPPLNDPGRERRYVN
jgi:hypothetical protein